MGWPKRRRQAKFIDEVRRKILIKVRDGEGEPLMVLENLVGNTHEEVLDQIRDFRHGGLFIDILESMTDHSLATASFHIISPNVPCPDCGVEWGYAMGVEYHGRGRSRTVRDLFTKDAPDTHREDCQFLDSIREATE